MGWYIFIFWIALTPFIVWGGYFENPKVFAFLIAGFFLSLFWVVKLIREQNAVRLSKKDFWYWFWLAALTISGVFGIHPLVSILGGSYRYQGVVFFLTLWLIGKTLQLAGKRNKKLLYKGIGAAVIIESLIVFYQFIFGKYYLGHPLGTLGEPNALAGFFAIGVYFVFISFPKILAAVPSVAIIMTQSRAGILAVVPNLGYLFTLWKNKTHTILIALTIVVAGALVFYLSSVKGTSFFENRQIIWPVAIQQILKKPFLGYGAESGEVVFNNAFYALGFPLSDLIIDRAHNLFLDVAMWSGGLGLTAFIFWLYYSFKEIKKMGKKLAALSFLVFAFFQPLSVVHWVLFIVLIS